MEVAAHGGVPGGTVAFGMVVDWFDGCGDAMGAVADGLHAHAATTKTRPRQKGPARPAITNSSVVHKTTTKEGRGPIRVSSG